MGLGLYLAAKVSAPTSTRELFDQIETAGEELADELGDPFATWFWGSDAGETLYLELCPLDENIEFRREPERVICSAKTSGSGPGYHLMVVALLDRLERAHGLAFRASEADETSDETGYLEQRDPAALKAEMAAQLRGIANVLLTHASEGAGSFCLGFPLDFVPKRDAFALTTLGEREVEWFERMARSEGAELEALAAEHYVLWDTEPSAANFRKLGIALGWMQLPWTAPEGERERDLYECVLDCFERARELDPAIALPELELAELRALLESDATGTPPRPRGIGYRRGTVRRSLPGGWTVELPGWFRDASEDDGTTKLYYFGNRTLRASTFTCQGADNASDVLRSIERARSAEALPIDAEHLAGAWSTEWSAEEQCELAHVWVAKPDGICCATFAYHDEGDREWVREVSRTIRPPS